MTTTTSHQKTTANTATVTTPALPTFMDHIRELQGRLFSVVAVFLLVSAASYPFFGRITEILLRPLDEGLELVYLTPGGAFSFIIKVCIITGIIGALPVIIYHLYRFVMPVVRPVRMRTVLLYSVSSLLLAMTGVVFAYLVSLPAALYFLTGFNLDHINPMLTIDSYFSFITTYMLAGALVFQIPLVIMIINAATPLKPSKMMKFQKHILVGSFIVAAIISPTPDALNQALLASPMIVMYQIGIMLVWRKNRRRSRLERKVARRAEKMVTKQPIATGLVARPGRLAHAQSAAVPMVVRKTQPTKPPALEQIKQPAVPTVPKPTMMPRRVDGMLQTPRRTMQSGPRQQMQRPPHARQNVAGTTNARSIDGFMTPRRA